MKKVKCSICGKELEVCDKVYQRYSVITCSPECAQENVQRLWKAKQLEGWKLEIHNAIKSYLGTYVDIHLKHRGIEVFYTIISSLGVAQIQFKKKYLVIGMRTGQPIYLGDEPIFTG